MRTISIITAWAAETGSLLADYYQAVQGSAQVISIDNACPAATATSLAEMTTHLCGEYVRNAENIGFAAANNQGYTQATGDIIVFLNSDVAPTGPWLQMIAADVRDGALYGPSLQSQLVAGNHIPYLEGWCIAATRQTWESLMIETDDMGFYWYGPWDQIHYPGPYWEDNDLCLRAFLADIHLVQTAWPIVHKGGRTAGPVMKHAASFATNEHTFTQRVLAALKNTDYTDLYSRYLQHYYTQSDMQHHLGLLYSLAKGNVVELGTRSGVSTSALLAGVERHGGHVWSVDLEDCGTLFDTELWTFLQHDSRNAYEIMRHHIGLDTPIDLLLVDTEHVTEQTEIELLRWADYMRPGGTILLHDIETFPGVRRAVIEFCAKRGWYWTPILPCHGMAVVEVPI